MSVAAVLASLAAAGCYAVAAALQHRAARRQRPHRALDPRLLVRLLGNVGWLAGAVADIAGTVLQALALRLGELAGVQPLLVSGLFLAILLEAALERRRPRRRELIAVALSSAGLTAFLLAARPEAGVPDPTPAAWALTGLGCAVFVAACLAAASAVPRYRAAALGVGTGVLYAVTAALLKAVADRLGAPLELLADWHLYVLLAVGLSGLVLNQAAFQGGRLTAPLTALSLSDPVASVLIALAAFHERLSGSVAALSVETVAAVVMAAGILLTGGDRTAG